MRLGHTSDSPNHVIQRNYKPSGHNPKNCIVIQKNDEKSNHHFVPSRDLMLSNVMSQLVPKIHELAQVLKNTMPIWFLLQKPG